MDTYKVHSVLGDQRASGHRLLSSVLSDTFEVDNSEPKKDDTTKVDDSVLDVIFSVNPLTLLPDGDLSVFLNDNTSPEVRDYIARNLMLDNPEQSDISGDYRGKLSDDDIVLYARNDGESAADYRYRVYNALKQDIEHAKAANKQSSE